MSRVAYETINAVERRHGKSVIDASKVLAFRWTSIGATQPKSPPIAVIQMKLKRAHHIFPEHRPHIVTQLARMTGRFEFQVFAGFSWHEIHVVLYSSGLDDIRDFLQSLLANSQRARRLQEVMTTVVWDPMQSYLEQPFSMEVALKVQDYSKFSLTTETLIRQPRYGFLDLVEVRTAGGLNELDPILAEYEESARYRGLQKFAATVFPSGAPRLSPPQAREEIQIDRGDSLDGATAQRPRRGLDFSRWKRAGDVDIVQEKVDALRTQILILRNNERLKYLIHPDLLNTLEMVHTAADQWVDQDIHGYLAMVRSAVQQRLWGTYPLSGRGLVNGFSDGFGGFQRILLACEYFMARVMRIMLTGHTEPPPILVLFDYPALHHEDLTVYERVRQFYPKAPIILRLPAMKYEPWYWHRGIWSVAEWCRELILLTYRSSGISKYQRRIPPSVSRLAARVLDRPTLWRLTVSESDNTFVEERTDTGGYKINIDKRDRMVAEFGNLPSLDLRGESPSLRELGESLLRGEVPIDKSVQSDPCFLRLVNAYYGLPITDRRAPKCVNAFLIGLYYVASYAARRGAEQ